MPRLKDKGIIARTHFQTPRDSVHEEFLNPVLTCAQLYQQKTAFLSTETFRLLRRGLSGLLKNKGRLQLIISDQLENKELQAIVEGYARKHEALPHELLDKCAEELRIRLIKLLDAAGTDDLQGYEILASLVQMDAVQVRIALTNTAGGLFHSKKGIITDAFGDYIVFTGSPNFTAAGLQTNYEEVDIIAKSWETESGQEHVDDFKVLWAGQNTAGYYTVQFEERFIDVLSNHPRLKIVSEVRPLDARIRGLEEAFRILRTGESLSAKYNYVKLAETRFNFLPLQPKADLSLMELFPHQIEGAKQLVARVHRFGTALLGDSVGLGKTRTAGVAIRLAREQGLVKKVLILAPRKLHAQWDEELREVRIDRSDYRIISKDQFLRWSPEKMEQEARPYDFIIVDEAHQGLRNHRAKGWQNFSKLPQKNGLLITATPWNNSRDDLYNLFSLFCRENSFEGLFAPGQRKRSRRVFEENDSLYKAVWHQLCIQRTRRMIPNLGAMYPKRIPQADLVPYSNDQTLRFSTLSDRISRLKMPYFNLLQFINPDLELNALVSFRHKLLLFKRAESSFFAFRRTLERFRTKTDLFRDAVREANSPASFRHFLRKWAANRNFLLEDNDEDLITLLEDLDEAEASRLEKVDKAIEGLSDSDFMACRAALDAALTEDTFELSRIIREFPEEGDLGKWELVEHLVEKHRKAGQKVIIVSQFVDTSLYVYNKLYPKLEEHGVGLVTGQESLDDHPMANFGSGVLANGVPKLRDEVLSLFAPIAKKRESKGIKGTELNVLVGSDTISVGQNLQDATVLINLDLPYNPMIIEQRIGRIDRPRNGAHSGSVHIHYFYNHQIIEAETNLRRILEGKIRSILKDVNFDSVLLPGYEELIERIKAESPQTVLDLLADLRDKAPEWTQQDSFLLDDESPNFSEQDREALQRLRSSFDPNLVKHDEPVVGTNGFQEHKKALIAADLEVTFFDNVGRTLSSRFVPVILSSDGKVIRSLEETEQAMQPRSIIGTSSALKIKDVWETLRKLDEGVILEADSWKRAFQIGVEKRIGLRLEKQAAQKVNIGPLLQYIDHVANDDRLYRQHVGDNAEVDRMVGNLRSGLPNALQDDQRLVVLLRELRDKPYLLWGKLQELHGLVHIEPNGQTGAAPLKNEETTHYTSVNEIQIRVVNLQLMRTTG